MAERNQTVPDLSISVIAGMSDKVGAVRQEKASEQFDKLTDRQRECLRHVFDHRKSHEIAHLVGTSARAVDKQLILAKNVLGAASRFEAARLLAQHESEVETSYPANIPPPRPSVWPLPMPVPTDDTPANTMTWQQVLAWSAIVAIATPIGLTVAAMVIVALTLMLGMKPT
jgi:DNA-binding CsgD family transcriptional regulator